MYEKNRMKLNFFDEYWIEFRRGTIRRWFAPEFHSYCPGGAYCSLLYDPDRKKYRIYAENLVNPADDDARVLTLVESDDLINFEYVHADNGSTIIFDGGTGLHGTTIMYDPIDKDASRRYKLCGMLDMGALKSGRSQNTPVVLAFSSDGIHWEAHNELVCNSQISDALNKLFYNPCTSEYTLLHRAAFVDRRICVRTSKDLINWSNPNVILHPGTNYNDGCTSMQHYSMTAKYFDGIFYGLLWRYNTCLYGNDYTRMFGYMEPELVYSYDGKEFLYTSGKPLIERPYPPKPGCCGLAPEDICESYDGKNYYILLNGQAFIHGTEESNKRLHEVLAKKKVPSGGAMIYKIRKDGFCGIESVDHGGMLITKCIELLKDDLSFNLRADCGYVRFALMNRDGSFINGFSFDECIQFEFDNCINHTPKWKNHSINEAIGKQLRIAVELNTAIIHCISATARPFVRQRMESFSDPSGITTKINTTTK